MTKTIQLLDRPQEINVQRKYKTVWIAAGQYRGKRIQVKARSERDALAAWLDAATGAPPTDEAC